MKAMLCVLLAIFFGMAGRAHFTRPEVYLAIMPDWIPPGWHRPLVDLTGVLEILGGVGLLLPATRPGAAGLLSLLLVAMFPANLHMAVHNLPFGDFQPPRWFHLVRLPLQLVLMGRVQGVGFRAYTLRHGRALGLSGWVRNLADGSVELVAEGPTERLGELLTAIRRGPPAARVECVYDRWSEAQGGLGPFGVG